MKKFQKFLKGFVDVIQFIAIILIWAIWIGLHLLFLLSPWFLLLYIIYPIVYLVFWFKSLKLKKYGQANVIVHGGKGSGKSLLFQKLILLDKETLGNIDFGYNKVVSPFDFYESISPNDTKKMMLNKLVLIKKNDFYEGKNYYFDDTNMFASNTEDAFLKKYFTSMSLFILGQRHFYNSCSILNAQSLERIYKNLRELQLDGYLKAERNIGFGRFISALPIFNKYVFINYLYHSNYNSAVQGLLPYKEIAILDTAMSSLHVGAGRALEKIYNAENGLIFRSTVALKKKSIKYDTREYHKWIFGNKFLKST